MKQKLTLICTLAACLSAQAAAQTIDYPKQPVTIVVPFAAGGGTDAIARLAARTFGDKYGKPFVVENRLGAGGNVAANAVAKSTPDGHTLLMATSGTLSTNASLYKNLPYDPAKDLIPVALLCAVPFVLVVNPNTPIKSVSDLIRLAKDSKEKLNYASGGAGTFHHMMGETLKTIAGIDLVHVPYKGGAPAVSDVVAGHLPLMFAELPAVRDLIATGKLRALGITTKDRAPAALDIVPLAEAGLAGFDAAAWQMLAAPASTPTEIVQLLNRDANEMVGAEASRKNIINLGFTPIGKGTPAELSQYVRTESARWRQLIEQANIALSE